MLNVVIEFVWERPAKRKGFAWQDTETDDVRLVRVEGAAFVPYEPLKECTGLFRTFGDLTPEPGAMLSFANRYGALGSGWDDHGLWKEGIARMKTLVAAWDALTAQKWTTLRDLFSKFPARGQKTLFQPGTGAKGARPDELVNATVHLLYNEVGGMTFGWTFGVWSRQSNPPVVWHQKAKCPVLKLTPPSLWHAMYLQFAQAILGNKSYQLCQVCGRWFELAPGLNRADRQTCSDYCRVKLYRIRKQQARDLRSHGWSPQRIAKKLGSDIGTINNWISQNKE
jgi:hypothetical protein